MYHTWVVGSAAGRGHRSGAVAGSLQVRQELALQENSGGLRKRWRVHVLSCLGPVVLRAPVHLGGHSEICSARRVSCSAVCRKANRTVQSQGSETGNSCCL